MLKQKEQENINSFDKYFEKKNPIFINPYLFDLNVDSFNLINSLSDSYLPYDTGIEIECSYNYKNNKPYSKSVFDHISNIVENNSTESEQRLRIPTGLIGLKCVWDICEVLQEDFILSSSGIHLHIDLTKYYDSNIQNKFKNNSDFIKKELDTWNYKGTYNKWRDDLSGGWVGFNFIFKTIEFRICEMTFNYEKLIKRIIHCQYIVKCIIEKDEILSLLKQDSIINNNDRNSLLKIIQENKHNSNISNKSKTIYGV